MSSPKPWQAAKSRKQVTSSSPSSIEIFEGKPAIQGPTLLESTPADGYIRIVCKEDAQFFVPTKVVERFKCVDVIVHGKVEFKEKRENVIRFPDFRSEVLESVMRFEFIEHLYSLKAEKYWGQNPPRAAFQFEVDPSQVMELLYAAHFFGLSSLLNVAASMIAHHLKDVQDVSSMPPDLAWCVAEKFSVQDLFDAEERADFLSLKLDTSSLWMKHCDKFFQGCIINPVPVSEDYPVYENWHISEGPPPTSWKSLCISSYLQQVADRQDGSSNKELLAEIKYKGKWAYAHTIRSTIWDWVMTGPTSLSFKSYAAEMPNLLSLCLAKVPLGEHLNDERLDFGQILQKLPLLQLLDISETGFTKDAAIRLSNALKHHEKLQVLRIAYNCLLTEGYAAIVEVLPYARSMKVLDVRENGITVSLPDISDALNSCTLEHLLLDGNCRDVSDEFTRVDMTKNGITICSIVPPTLKCLHLQQCDLSDSHVVLLAHALKGHSTIQKIDLSDNKITSEGASAIFQWMQENKSLIELYLVNNNITDSCATELTSAVFNHPSLEKLSLKGNYSYGEERIPEVLHAAMERGYRLIALRAKKFMLDLRSTDVSFGHRARLQRQALHFTSLHLLI